MRTSRTRAVARRKGGPVPPPPAASRRIGAIHVGATSVRMIVVEIAPGGARRILESVSHPIALGADTFQAGTIRPQTLRALGQILRKLQQVLRENGVEAWRAVGTSAIREASNRDVVIDRLQHASGVRLEMLDPAEESRIAFGRLLPFLRANRVPGGHHVLVVDLGGGSTEFLLLRGERVVLGESHRLGVARLLYGAGGAGRMDAQAYLEAAIREAVASTRELLRDADIRELVAGNSVLGAALANDRRVRRIWDGIAVSAEDLGRIHREASALSLSEVAARFSLGLADAELLVPALAVLRRFVEVTRVKRVLLAEVDFLPGLVEEVVRELKGESSLAAFRPQIVGSVEGILEKYGADMDHAEKVRALSMGLFGALREYLDLGEKDGLLLELAALLHDVGRFISDRDHHKHSMYIINWTEIMGLSERERRLVGLVARYHRKARPQPEHVEFGGLAEEDRMRVRKLAALLRLADAMDRGHRQLVRRVRISLGETEIDLAAEAAGDLAVEGEAVKTKGNLFSDLTGLTVRFRRVLS